MQMSSRLRLIAAAVLIGLVPLAAAPPARAETTAEARQSAATALEAARIGDLVPAERLLAGTVAGGERKLLAAQVAAARGDHASAEATLESYWQDGNRTPSLDARAHEIRADVAFAEGEFAAAAEAAQAIQALTPAWPAEEMDAIRQLGGIAAILRSAPVQRLEARGDGRAVPASRDKVGLIRTTMTVGDRAEQAVIDTGAALSVASASAAKRLGMRMLEGEGSVGNSVGGDVAVKVAIADRIEVAGAVLRDVPFLVLADEALTFPVPGGYTIDTIVGLPVLRATGSVRFGPGDTLAIAPATAGAKNLRLVGTDPYVVMTVDGAEMPLFLDTGANRSALLPQALAAHPLLVPRETGEMVRKAGAGGMQEVERKRIDNATMAIGGRSAIMAELSVDPEGHGRGYGTLGNDLFRKFDSVTIDFDAMTMSAEPPVAAAGEAKAP